MQWLLLQRSIAILTTNGGETGWSLRLNSGESYVVIPKHGILYLYVELDIEKWFSNECAGSNYSIHLGEMVWIYKWARFLSGGMPKYFGNKDQ